MIDFVLLTTLVSIGDGLLTNSFLGVGSMFLLSVFLLLDLNYTGAIVVVLVTVLSSRLSVKEWDSVSTFFVLSFFRLANDVKFWLSFVWFWDGWPGVCISCLLLVFFISGLIVSNSLGIASLFSVRSLNIGWVEVGDLTLCSGFPFLFDYLDWFSCLSGTYSTVWFSRFFLFDLMKSSSYYCRSSSYLWGAVCPNAYVFHL